MNYINIFYIFIVIAVVLLLLTIFLFVYLDIPNAIRAILHKAPRRKHKSEKNIETSSNLSVQINKPNNEINSVTVSEQNRKKTTVLQKKDKKQTTILQELSVNDNRKITNEIHKDTNALKINSADDFDIIDAQSFKASNDIIE